MRLHRNLVFAVVDGLNMIFNEGEYADKVVEKLLKRDKRWGARDRGFIAETTYDIVRWKRLYAKIAEVSAPYSRENLFRMFAVWAVLRGIELPDWKQLESTPTRRIKGKFDELSQTRKFRESIPDWMDQLGEEQLGDEQWSKELKALNEKAVVVLRANTLKTSKSGLKNLLEKEGINTNEINGYPEALVLTERSNVFRTETFKKGNFEVQDASSQKVGFFCEVAPGMRVVDCCAGAGGKTLHLAAIMENKGQLIALDIYQNKLKELKRRAKRAGAHNVEARHIVNSKVYKKLYNSADRVLIDAPCSGLGVLKRNPDAKWKLQPEFIKKLVETQREILVNYSKIVKKEGKLIYVTCSILPEENEKQITWFLASKEGQAFQLESQKTIFPSESGFDGFYMARLAKK